MDKARVVLKIGTRPVQQTKLVREAPIEHFFQALDTGTVLEMQGRSVSVVGDPIYEPIRVPNADERLTRYVKLTQAS